MNDADSKIIECAKALVRAINESGRTVLRPDISENGFGSLNIWIDGNEIEVEYGPGTDNPYKVSGYITDVK